MKTKYRVALLYNDTYKVIIVKTILGKRISVDESESNETTERVVFIGSLSDCYAFIKLKEGDYL